MFIKSYYLLILSFFLVVANAQASERIKIQLDRSDGQKIPALLSANWNAVGCAPTLILSHGLGGDENGLAYISNTAEKIGYRVINIAHLESGRAKLKQVFVAKDKTEILLSKKIWDGRSKDLQSAINLSTQNNCKPKPFVLGGHSLGAALTMVEAGANTNIPYAGQNRFDAYIALSPQGIGWAFPDAASWKNINKPVLMVTGTEDNGFDGDFNKRLDAWRGLPNLYKRLVVIDGATHSELAGRGDLNTEKHASTVISEFLSQLNGKWEKSHFHHVNGLNIQEK